MPSFNRIILQGNLTRDIELRYLPSGTAIATLGLAVNRRYGKGDDAKEETCFVDVVAFGRQAETASEYLQKGQPVLVEGRLRFQSWEKDGQRRSKHDVVAENIQFLAAAPHSREQQPHEEPAASPASDDDVPF